MSAAPELLPKWSARADPAVKSRCVAPPSGSLKLSMKEYTSWHSRISNLITFCVLLGVGTILCVVTSLNAVGHLRNPERGFLLTSMRSLPSHLDGVVGRSDSPFGPTNASDAAPPLMLMPHPVDLSTLSDVYHNMTEEELLRRASDRALRRPRPVSVTPKVAFLFLARGPMPLAPLWDRYFKGHAGLYSIYLHAHPNYRPEFPPESVFYRRNIPSKVTFNASSVFHALFFASQTLCTAA